MPEFQYTARDSSGKKVTGTISAGGQREAAVARLVALGERCRPYLKKELENADEGTQWWIRAALEQINK